MLDALTPADTDEAFCDRIANEFLAHGDIPMYKFFIDHNVKREHKGNPKTGACPLFYNWQRKETCGIEYDLTARTPDVQVAGVATIRKWIIDALKLGYIVSSAYGSSGGTSLRFERRNAEFRSRPFKVSPHSTMDDEIPF